MVLPLTSSVTLSKPLQPSPEFTFSLQCDTEVPVGLNEFSSAVLPRPEHRRMHTRRMVCRGRKLSGKARMS